MQSLEKIQLAEDIKVLCFSATFIYFTFKRNLRINCVALFYIQHATDVSKIIINDCSDQSC